MNNHSKMMNSIIKKYYKARLENQKNLYIHPSYELEQKLMSCIIRGQEEEAKRVIEQINQLERARLADDPLRSLKNSLICSCTLFTRAIIKAGVLPEDAYNLSDVYIQQIERIPSIDRLQKLEFEMVSSFIQTLKKEKHSVHNSIVNRAIHYIYQEILHHDLSLSRIADHVGVHPTYLSNIFKRTVGVNITEFCNRKRIEESTYFLIHSTSSLSEIAHLFGFCNQSYYAHLFKKFMGMTPKQYRNLNLGQHEVE